MLFLYYWFMLRNKVFHSYNRFYLLAIVAISFILPLCSINIFHTSEAPKASVIKMLTVVTESDDYIDDVILQAKQTSQFTIMSILPFIYALISIVFLLLLLQMLIGIVKLLQTNEIQKVENIRFVNTHAAKGTPFSFFQTIFWNKQIDPHSPAGTRIFKHELAHIQERHSYDKLFLNIVLILFWANPVYWIIRKELSMIHEFMADKIAVEDGDTTAFAAMILATTYPNHTLSITNNFFYSPIKRRLMMLTKNQHPKINYLSRLLVLPLAVIVFAAFTIKAREYKKEQNTKNVLASATNRLSTDEALTNTNLENLPSNNTTAYGQPNYGNKQITVVIDAGHGGQDPGAKNDEGIVEKDLTLQLIKKIKALNKNENIHIILTRETDIYNTPQEKASFANEQKPDLFISVHIDAAINKGGKIKNGLNIYVPNDSFPISAKSKLFASAIIGAFENNYALQVPKTTTQRKVGIYVLRAVQAPSVLIQAGYITNKKDAAYLTSDLGQKAFANNVLNAINNFVKSNDFQTNNYNQINEAVVPLDEIVAMSNYTTNTNENVANTRYDDTILYKGKKIKLFEVKADALSVKNEKVTLYFYDNTSTVITVAEAKRIGLTMPTTTTKVTSHNKTKYPDTLAWSGTDSQDDRELVFSKTETPAEFPGGLDAWKKYLMSNLDGKLPTTENWAAGAHNIMVIFIVEKNGSLTNITTENYINSKTAQHCIDIIKNGPKWIPAKQNGKTVKAYRRQPITFVIAGENDVKKEVSNIEPVFKIGNLLPGNVKVEDFKAAKNIILKDGYTLLDYSAYFWGNGFPNAISAKIAGNSIAPLREQIAKCVVGTKIVFTDIKFRDNNGIRTLADKSYVLF